MANSRRLRGRCGRRPKANQYKKETIGVIEAGRRRKRGPIQIDALEILDEVFPVRSGDQVKHMSAKEVERRRIMKKAIQDKHLPSIIHLLELFEKHGCARGHQQAD